MKIVETEVNGSINKKICLIADIHFSADYNIKLLDKILNEIRMTTPDYICVTGDIIDSPLVQYESNIERLYYFLKKIGECAKVIVSIGNHEVTQKKDYVYPDKFISTLKAINNVIVLDNGKYIDNGICFIGYTELFASYHKERGLEKDVISELNTLLADISSDNYNILLSHNPLYVTRRAVYTHVYNFEKINLVLCGHTHNGLLPNFMKTNTVLVTPQKNMFVRRARGHFCIKNADVIITGGIIKLSKTAGILSKFNNLYAVNMDYIIVNENVKTKK